MPSSITKGPQERMREFDELEEAPEIHDLFAQDVRRPPDDITFSEESAGSCSYCATRLRSSAGHANTQIRRRPILGGLINEYEAAG